MRISTSILNCDNRVDSVQELNKTKNSYVHIDVMDGKFVADTQFMDIEEIRKISKVSKYPLDVHLMVENPILVVEKLNDMNIEFVTIHQEIKEDIDEVITKIREKGYKVGLSIKPETDIKEVEPYLGNIDLVLIMSVEPGKGGQKFLSQTVSRVDELRKLILKNGYHVEIEVDGGINDETIKQVKNIDIAVVGSYITKSDDYSGQIDKLIQCSSTKNETISLGKNKISKNVIANLLMGFGVISILIWLIWLIWFINGIRGNDDYRFWENLIDHPMEFIIGIILIVLALIIKRNGNASNILEQKKKRNKYRVLLILGILPFVFLLGVGFYSMIFGLVWFWSTYYGLESFCVSICSMGVVLWPVLVVGLAFVIISIVQLKKIKKLSN